MLNPINNIDQYFAQGFEGGEVGVNQIQDLMKAMSAGETTGRTLDGTITSGSSLKAESLDPTLKILTNRDKHIVFWKMIPKQKAYNTVEEFNQLVDYGSDVGISNLEGETPTFVDSQFRRESVLVRYMGVAGEVTHPFTLTRLGGTSGQQNAMAIETYNKTQLLIRGIDKLLATGDNDLVPTEFDGVFKQHYDGVSTTLDGYSNDSSVIDARGYRLNDERVEEAVQAVVNNNFGNVSHIMSSPIVFSNYVKEFHESKRVMVGQSGAVVGATMGQSVNTIQTQNGAIDVAQDIFFDWGPAKTYDHATTNAKAPAAPTLTTTATVQTDTSTKFTDGAGDYVWGVVAGNRYGESAMLILNSGVTPLTVGATEAVDLDWAHTDGAYAVTYFKVFRSPKGVTATTYATCDYYAIFSVTAAEWAAGYDGGGAGDVRDRNRSLPNTKSALVWDNSIDVYAFKQLAPVMKMDLAITAPSFRFMVLCYGTPVLFAPKKMSKIVNIGVTTNP